tara:strand:- start:146 stop:463 length:318 start_codon:yes stop_codon:yes gene_type:complete
MNDNKTNNMTDEELNSLATKIVSRLMRLKTVEDFFKHITKSEVANAADYESLDLTEEEDAVGEIARLMTLLNLFQEDEEYEKCAIVKRRLDVVNKILKKYEDDEI